MILGNAGIVGGIASLIIGFTDIQEGWNTWIKIGILAGGIGILWILANSKWVDRHLSRLINKVLKRYSRMDVHDYASLLHLSGEYRITELAIDSEHWLVDKKIKNSRLRDEGLNILAIKRKDGTYLGAPDGKTTIREGDTLIVYGRDKSFENIENRARGKSGNREHKEMVKEQKEVTKQEKQEDPGRK
jgi:K+/H+ antiporter YhaU regulatory subunit KhtT